MVEEDHGGDAGMRSAGGTVTTSGGTSSAGTSSGGTSSGGTSSGGSAIVPARGGVGNEPNEASAGSNDPATEGGTQAVGGARGSEASAGEGGGGAVDPPPNCDLTPVGPTCAEPTAGSPLYSVSLGSLVKRTQGRAPATHTRGINVHGVIIGTSETCDGERSFVFEQGEMHELSSLTPQSGEWQVVDINDSGVIAGMSDTRPTLWRNRVPEAIPGLPDSLSLYVVALTNNEQVLLAGYRSPESPSGACLFHSNSTSTNCRTSFIHRDGALTEIPFDQPSYSLSGGAINESGQVVGEITLGTPGESGYTVPFFYDGETTHVLPTFGAGGGAHGINGAGDVVGYALLDDGSSRAMLWRDGQPIDISPCGEGCFDARAHYITNSGAIVGNVRSTTSSSLRPFVYRDGTYTFLDVFESRASVAAINDAGIMVGARATPGATPGATIHKAVVWSPTCFDMCCPTSSSPAD